MNKIIKTSLVFFCLSICFAEGSDSGYWSLERRLAEERRCRLALTFVPTHPAQTVQLSQDLKKELEEWVKVPESTQGELLGDLKVAREIAGKLLTVVPEIPQLVTAKGEFLLRTNLERTSSALDQIQKILEEHNMEPLKCLIKDKSFIDTRAALAKTLQTLPPSSSIPPPDSETVVLTHPLPAAMSAKSAGGKKYLKQNEFLEWNMDKVHGDKCHNIHEAVKILLDALQHIRALRRIEVLRNYLGDNDTLEEGTVTAERGGGDVTAAMRGGGGGNSRAATAFDDGARAARRRSREGAAAAAAGAAHEDDTVVVGTVCGGGGGGGGGNSREDTAFDDGARAARRRSREGGAAAAGTPHEDDTVDEVVGTDAGAAHDSSLVDIPANIIITHMARTTDIYRRRLWCESDTKAKKAESNFARVAVGVVTEGLEGRRTKFSSDKRYLLSGVGTSSAMEQFCVQDPKGNSPRDIIDSMEPFSRYVLDTWLHVPGLFADSIRTYGIDVESKLSGFPSTVRDVLRNVLGEQSELSFAFCLSLFLSGKEKSLLLPKIKLTGVQHEKLIEECQSVEHNYVALLLYARNQLLGLFAHSEQAALMPLSAQIQEIATKEISGTSRSLKSIIVTVITTRDMCRNCHKTMFLRPPHLLLQRMFLQPLAFLQPPALTAIDVSVVPIQYVVVGLEEHKGHMSQALLLPTSAGAAVVPEVYSSRNPNFYRSVSDPIGLPSEEKLAVIHLLVS